MLMQYLTAVAVICLVSGMASGNQAQGQVIAGSELQFSGIHPHLAYFNEQAECVTGPGGIQGNANPDADCGARA